MRKVLILFLILGLLSSCNIVKEANNLVVLPPPPTPTIGAAASYDSLVNKRYESFDTLVLFDSALQSRDTLQGFLVYTLFYNPSNCCDTCPIIIDSIKYQLSTPRKGQALNMQQTQELVPWGIKKIQEKHFWFSTFVPHSLNRFDLPIRYMILGEDKVQ